MVTIPFHLRHVFEHPSFNPKSRNETRKSFLYRSGATTSRSFNVDKHLSMSLYEARVTRPCSKSMSFGHAETPGPPTCPKQWPNISQ